MSKKDEGLTREQKIEARRQRKEERRKRKEARLKKEGKYNQDKADALASAANKRYEEAMNRKAEFIALLDKGILSKDQCINAVPKIIGFLADVQSAVGNLIHETGAQSHNIMVISAKQKANEEDLTEFVNARAEDSLPIHGEKIKALEGKFEELEKIILDTKVAVMEMVEDMPSLIEAAIDKVMKEREHGSPDKPLSSGNEAPRVSGGDTCGAAGDRKRKGQKSGKTGRKRRKGKEEEKASKAKRQCRGKGEDKGGEEG